MRQIFLWKIDDNASSMSKTEKNWVFELEEYFRGVMKSAASTSSDQTFLLIDIKANISEINNQWLHCRKWQFLLANMAYILLSFLIHKSNACNLREYTFHSFIHKWLSWFM